MSAVARLEELGRLEFGNPEHIAAVRAREKALEEAEREENLPEFEVTLSFSGSYTTKVKAVDEAEAKMLASEIYIDLADAEVDTDCIEVTRVKKR